MVFKGQLLILVLVQFLLYLVLFYFTLFKANIEFRPDGTVLNLFGTSSLKTINFIKRDETLKKNNFSVKFVSAKTHRPYVFRGPGFTYFPGN